MTSAGVQALACVYAVVIVPAGTEESQQPKGWTPTVSGADERFCLDKAGVL